MRPNRTYLSTIIAAILLSACSDNIPLAENNTGESRNVDAFLNVEPPPTVVEQPPIVVDETFDELAAPTTVAAVLPKINALACLITIEGTLIEAIQRFDAACGLTPDRYCDNIGDNIFQCSNYVVKAAAPPIEVQEVEIVVSSTIEDTSPPNVDAIPETVDDFLSSAITTATSCSAVARTREEASTIFVDVCRPKDYVLADCDPISGTWTCSSDPIGQSAPANQIGTSMQTTGNGIITYNPIKGRSDTVPAGLAWADSYMANNTCFIHSTFDHNIGNVRYDTGKFGIKTIREIDGLLKAHPNYRKYAAGDPIYNDVQCGNGPANDAHVEDYIGGCAGRVDLGVLGCSTLGPKWDFANIGTPSAENEDSRSDIVIAARSVTANNTINTGDIWVDAIGEGNMIWVSGISDNVAATIEYIVFAHPEIDTSNITIVDEFDKFDIDTDMHDVIVRYAKYVGLNSAAEIDSYIGTNGIF